MSTEGLAVMLGARSQDGPVRLRHGHSQATGKPKPPASPSHRQAQGTGKPKASANWWGSTTLVGL
jgi:hypothetical protein